MNSLSPFLRRALAVVAVAAAAPLAVACGGSASSAGGSSGPGAGTASAPPAYLAQVLAYSRCMRTHGIPGFPDPDSTGHFNKATLRGLPISAARLRAANNACGHLLPGGPPPLTAAQQQDYLKAADCMRAHGISVFPDPVFSGGTVKFPAPPGGFNTNSPQFIHARQICQKLIPAGLPYSGSDG